ncbi:MAG: amidohydrolase family protein [Chitinophagales bacterium]|nr:amidohydrolase family protein [Chitinophagales bacterium]MDW8273769.1 amidohydrolase family protein [Chitinophagales bacterium]
MEKGRLLIGYFIILYFTLFEHNLLSQTFTLTRATIHVGNGEVLENGTISFTNGVITLVQKDPVFKTDETLGKIIDCNGKHVYPGLIALNTYLGLSEVEAVRATNDQSETGNYNPNVRSLIAYNTDSRVIGTVRSNGVTQAQIVPQGGRISGTSCVVNLEGWNWEDAAEIREDGIWLSWIPRFVRKGWWADPQDFEINKDYDNQLKELKTFFADAKSYSLTGKHEKVNLRFEAMRGLFNGSKKLYIRAAEMGEILSAIAFAEDFSIKPVIVGGEESWRIADILAQKNILVILHRTHQLPYRDDDDIHQPYKTPYLLQKAGVKFALCVPGFWQVRNLPFMAGTAAAYGLTKEQALAAITINAAEICGLEKTGLLKPGYVANIVVSEGDILDMKTSKITHIFIKGKPVDISNKQTELFEKYKNKYGITD